MVIWEYTWGYDVEACCYASKIYYLLYVVNKSLLLLLFDLNIYLFNDNNYLFESTKILILILIQTKYNKKLTNILGVLVRLLALFSTSNNYSQRAQKV